MSDLSSRTVAQLKEELQQKGVDVKGLKLKKDYVEKLQAVLHSEPKGEGAQESVDSAKPDEVVDPSDNTATNEEQGKHVSSVEHAKTIQDPETTLPTGSKSGSQLADVETSDIKEAQEEPETAITKDEKDEQILGDADGDLGEKMEAAAEAGKQERAEEQSSVPIPDGPMKQAANDRKEEGNIAVAAAEAQPPQVVAKDEQPDKADQTEEDVNMDQAQFTAEKRKRAEEEDDEQEGKRTRLSPSARQEQSERHSPMAHQDISKPQAEEGEDGREATSPKQTETADQASHPLPDNLSHVSHPATRALYISNLKRPLLTPDLKAWLIEQGVSQGVSEDDVLDGEAGVEAGVWLDGVKSHCYCIFKKIDIAIAAAAKIQGQVFPVDHGVALTVEFVPEDVVPSLVQKEKEAWGNGRNKLVLEITKRIGFVSGSDFSFDLVPPKGKDGVRSGGGLGDLRPPRATPASRPAELGGRPTFQGGFGGARPDLRPPPSDNGWSARANGGSSAGGLQRTRTQPPLMYRESMKYAREAPSYNRPPQQQRGSGGWGARDSGSWGSQQRDNAARGNWRRSNDNGWGQHAQNVPGGW